jgi:hypothetical protein
VTTAPAPAQPTTASRPRSPAGPAPTSSTAIPRRAVTGPQVRVAPGEKLPMPSPLDFLLDTAGFAAPWAPRLRRDPNGRPQPHRAGSVSPQADSRTVQVRVPTGPDSTASAR